MPKASLASAKKDTASRTATYQRGLKPKSRFSPPDCLLGPPSTFFDPDNSQFAVVKRGFLVVLSHIIVPSMTFMLLGISMITHAERPAR